MRNSIPILAVAALLVAPMDGRSERPPQSREDADLVVVGKVHAIMPKKEKFGGDGVLTRYLAEVKVTAVERGKAVKSGEAITVRWFHVTKNPSKRFVGAFGHDY